MEVTAESDTEWCPGGMEYDTFMIILLIYWTYIVINLFSLTFNQIGNSMIDTIPPTFWHE